jgi:hypothetical protein
LVSLRVLDGNGQGYVSNVIEAIDWTIAHRRALGIRVLNLSFGHPPAESYRTDPLAHAVERAWAAGLVVVASAGNRGRDGHFTVNAPGSDPYVLTVGAMNDVNTADRGDDIKTTYSSKGPSFGDHILKPGSGRAGESDRLDARPGGDVGAVVSRSGRLEGSYRAVRQQHVDGRGVRRDRDSCCNAIPTCPRTK